MTNNPLTITDRVGELHARAATESPDEATSACGREQAGLAAAGVPDGIPADNTVVADVDLLSAHGLVTTLYAPPATRPGSWCSTAVPGARTAISRCPPTKPTCRCG